MGWAYIFRSYGKVDEIMNNTKIKIELTVDELLIIMFCMRNSLLTGRNADLAAALYDKLDRIASGI